nr:helix-turn-helix transcriptional regulator [Antribacter gilvus]
MSRSQPFTTVGARLRLAREAAGLSLDQMALRTHYGKTTLTYYERGFRPVTSEVIAQYEEALGTPIDLDSVATLEYVGRADVDRRSFIRGAAYTVGLSALALANGEDLARIMAQSGGSVAGVRTVEAIRRVTDSFIVADETLGGGAMRTAVAEFLASDVATVLRGRFASEAVRGQAFSAAAEVAYLAGWKAHDSGLDGLAQRYYLCARNLARESGDAGHEAFILRILALQGCDLGQRVYSVRLAEASLARAKEGAVDEDTEALFHVAVARCQAETGDTSGAARTMSRAPRLLSERTENAPRWAAQWCSNKATLLNQAAKTFTAMGDAKESVQFLAEVTGQWDPNSKARIWALSMAELGHAQWDVGDAASATRTWSEALPVLQRLDSDRTSKAAAAINLAMVGGK